MAVLADGIFEGGPFSEVVTEDELADLAFQAVVDAAKGLVVAGGRSWVQVRLERERGPGWTTVRRGGWFRCAEGGEVKEWRP